MSGADARGDTARSEVARAESAWADALAAARLLGADPKGLGGAVLRGPPGAARDAWLAALRNGLPEGAPWRQLPLAIDDDRLLGGVDFGASLAKSTRVMARGLLEDAAGGVVVAASAERLPPATAGRIAAAMDAHAFALVLLDEGVEDERVAPALAERCAFRIEASYARPASDPPQPSARNVNNIGLATASDADLDALATAAAAFGVASMRGPLLAMRAAGRSAALAGRAAVAEEDLLLAARLVLAPRATRMPAASEPEAGDEEAGQDASPPQSDGSPPPPPSSDDPAPEPDTETEGSTEPPNDLVLKAVRAAVPPGVLAAMEAGRLARTAGGVGQGAQVKAARRGRPAGTRAGDPRRARLDIAATLAAAAPWQRARAAGQGSTPRLRLRREDFRVKRFVSRSESTTIFVVDASGSAALARLAEAKGAVELLLAEAYVRRTQVALIAFRGTGAELLLPPTRSLARAKRALADLAGGGGTPLAIALEAAQREALRARAGGRTPLIVMLTDGRGNIARSGLPGRDAAQADALAAARLLARDGIAAALIDTAPRPRPEAATLAAAMGARYVVLPRLEAGAVLGAVQGLAR